MYIMQFIFTILGDGSLHILQIKIEKKGKTFILRYCFLMNYNYETNVE